MKNLKSTILSATLALTAGVAYAQIESPEIPSFINKDANHIQGELPRFHRGLKMLEAGEDTVVRVLHIGDSHIQAEFVTNYIRERLQDKYGDAGRGLVAPLRLAGTNQSHDYAITKRPSDGTVLQTRLLKFPWPAEPGVTGISVVSNEPETYVVTLNDRPGGISKATTITSVGWDDYYFDTPHDSMTIATNANEALYGVVIENGKPGILYSAIGNNGACFTDYSLISGFPAETGLFNSDLIILSMGTNEGFSTMTDFEIERSVRDLIRSIRAYNPGADILVLTPMECQKNRNHGKKPLSEFYDINTRVLEAGEIIRKTALDEGVALWDFFPISGGNGASNKWLEAGLMNKDHIHLYKSGYEVMGELLFESLLPQ
ncbi:MAG: hypothetical protein HDS99_00040 [Bacteroidales bacterium]|nr:hypothetical protein [Bacteroidales bacterium]